MKLFVILLLSFLSLLCNSQTYKFYSSQDAFISENHLTPIELDHKKCFKQSRDIYYTNGTTLFLYENLYYHSYYQIELNSNLHIDTIPFIDENTLSEMIIMAPCCVYKKGFAYHFKNNHLVFIDQYINNEKAGLFKQYDQNGHKKIEGNQNYQPFGTWIFYDSMGFINATIDVIEAGKKYQIKEYDTNHKTFSVGQIIAHCDTTKIKNGYNINNYQFYKNGDWIIYNDANELIKKDTYNGLVDKKTVDYKRYKPVVYFYNAYMNNYNFLY